MLTPREIAERTGLSYRSVLRAIEDGELRGYRLRGRLRVDHEDFEAWKARNVVVTEHRAFDSPGLHACREANKLRKQRPAGSLRALHEATLVD